MTGKLNFAALVDFVWRRYIVSLRSSSDDSLPAKTRYEKQSLQVQRKRIMLGIGLWGVEGQESKWRISLLSFEGYILGRRAEQPREVG